MKLTTEQLRQIIKEEMRHLYEDEEEAMTDGDAGSVIGLLSDEFDMGLEILKSFEHKNLSPDAEMSLAQAIWQNTIGFDEDPKWLAFRDTVIEAEKTGFFYKIAAAEAEAQKYNVEIKGRIDQLASSLGMRDIELTYHISAEGIRTLPKFRNFLKEQGLL
jgi:hypothetical protein